MSPKLSVYRWEDRFSNTRKSAYIQLNGENWPTDEEVVNFVSSHNFGYFVGKEKISDGKRIKYVIVYID